LGVPKLYCPKIKGLRFFLLLVTGKGGQEERSDVGEGLVIASGGPTKVRTECDRGKIGGMIFGFVEETMKG
jgi:hypothetical protein